MGLLALSSNGSPRILLMGTCVSLTEAASNGKSYAALPLLPSPLATFPRKSGLFRDPGGRSRRGPPDVPDRASFKTEIISVRMSPDELRDVAKRAHDCGKCLSTYMRTVALGSIPRARPRRIEQEAVYQLGKIGNNLNQLTRVANSTGRLGESHRLQEILDKLLDAVRTLA